MFFELDVPVPEPALPLPPAYNPKGKAKQNTALKLSEQPLPPPLLFNATQIAALETRIELLAQLGYTVLCLTQTERGPIDPKSFINVLTALIATLNASPRKPPQIVLSTRLTLVLDNTCDGGFGLTQSNAALFGGYDVLALRPLTVQTFSQACLTHAAPGPLTAHIIVVPLSPRVPFPLKHTLVRTARRAGAVFELSFAGAIRGDEGWWGSAREVVRVAKGKGIVITGGGEPRAPRDLANLAGLLDLQPNVAHDAVTGTCRSVLIRARARRTYRSVISEPTLVIPGVAPTIDPLKSALDVPAEDSDDDDDSATDAEGGSKSGLKRKSTDVSGSARKRKRKKRR